MVPDQATKDCILNQPEIEGCKILQQDYLIEVPWVPLSLCVNSRQEVDNSSIIQEICEGTKRTVPRIAINHIRWLHNPKAQVKHDQTIVKTKGTLIISLPTQALQLKTVKSGIVINSQLFEAQLYDHRLRVKECFKCNQWGHTQITCAKQEKCGQCAGPHATRACPKERVSCVNCGQSHRAWQQKDCRTFQVYLEGIQAQRANLLVQSMLICNEGQTQATLQSDGFQIIQPKKRQRQETPMSSQIPQPKKGPGRPTYIEVAGCDPQQAWIHLGSQSTGTPQGMDTSTDEYGYVADSQAEPQNE